VQGGIGFANGALMLESDHSLQSTHSQQSTIRLVVVTRRRLDGEALAALFQSHPHYRVLCNTTSLKVASTVGRHRKPDVMLLDGSLAGQRGGEGIAALIHRIGKVPVMVLDDTVNIGHLAALMNLPDAGYYTRTAPLAEGIRRLLRGENAFDSAITERVHQTSHGWKFRPGSDTDPSEQLTPREIEVWKLIAQGHSVRRCAELLHLAPSTVDNHKSHLMKKLGVHNALDLTRMAIRDGLVSI
jgi:DNA-binding NarL/FixJ family response regulator